jgi:hypothetical protein
VVGEEEEVIFSNEGAQRTNRGISSEKDNIDRQTDRQTIVKIVMF